MTFDNFIFAILVIVVVLYLIKTASKLAFSILIILILFGVGFVWNGEEITENLRTKNILSAEQAESVQSFFDKFNEKREEHEVIDQDTIDNTYNNIKDKTLEQGDNWFTSIKSFLQKFFEKSPEEVGKTDAVGDMIKEELSVSN